MTLHHNSKQQNVYFQHILLRFPCSIYLKARDKCNDIKPVIYEYCITYARKLYISKIVSHKASYSRLYRHTLFKLSESYKPLPQTRITFHTKRRVSRYTANDTRSASLLHTRSVLVITVFKRNPEAKCRRNIRETRVKFKSSSVTVSRVRVTHL